MAYSVVQATETNSATGTFASAGAGHALIAFCFNQSATIPGLPTGWTNLGTGSAGGGTARSSRVAVKTAAGGETSVAFTGTLTTPQTVVIELNGIDVTIVGTQSFNEPLAASTTPTTATTLNAGASGAGAWVTFFGARSTSATWSAEARAGSTTGVTERADANGCAVAEVPVVFTNGADGGSASATLSTSVTSILARVYLFEPAAPAATTPPKPLIIQQAVNRAGSW